MSHSILIVEDESVLQNIYKIILEAHDYTVFTANNGLEGLAQVKKHKPELVILDNFMPIMSGIEFLRNVDLDQYPSMKIIAYSNLSDIKVEKEMLDLGAHAFVLKSSMTPTDLVDMAGKAFSN